MRTSIVCERIPVLPEYTQPWAAQPPICLCVDGYFASGQWRAGLILDDAYKVVLAVGEVSSQGLNRAAEASADVNDHGTISENVFPGVPPHVCKPVQVLPQRCEP